MKKQMKSIKKGIVMAGLIITKIFTESQIAYASDLETSKGVTGTVKLLTDAGKALLIIDTAVTVILLMYDLFKIKHAEDAGEAKPIKKHMKSTAIAGIAIFLVSGIFTIVLSYYK